MSILLILSTIITLGNMGLYVYNIGNDIAQIKNLVWVFLGSQGVFFELLAGMINDYLGEDSK